MNTRQRGFTLLEIVLVLVLIAISFTILPRFVFNGVSGAELRANVRDVATALRMTRNAAITDKREAVLTLNLDGREFTLPNDSRVHRLNEKIDLELFTAQSDLVAEKVGMIRFFPDGSSNGGRVTVGAGQRKFAVDIDWLTGRVTISELPGDARA
jgi:general secretion pathway protein H